MMAGHILLPNGKIKGNTMFDKELACAAAILAVSNMGQEKPSRDEVQRALAGKSYCVDTFTYWFAQYYMDDEMIEEAFLMEAESWVKALENEPDWKSGHWGDVWHDLVKPA